LLDRLVKLTGYLCTMRSGLVTAITNFNHFVSRYDNSVLKEAKKLEQLGISVSGALESPDEISDAPRSIKTQGEIIDVEPVDELEQ
ncbi:MAG: hypothetical protein NT032_01805, partial [Actinobacteria bacterium]|nr:hypothetical protein [Actinomycetota bacterium]